MPIRLCLTEKCGNPVVYRGRCATHARERERATHPNKAVYNTARWRYTRRSQLTQHPLCMEQGCGRVATDVDHRIPIQQGGGVWLMSNLQSLCAYHHGVKTRREQGATQ